MKISANMSVKPINISLDGLFAQKVIVNPTEVEVATIKVNKTGTQIISSPEVLLERLYFNVDLSINEVKDILSTITSWTNAEFKGYCPFINTDGSIMLVIGTNDIDYIIIGKLGNMEIPIFVSADFMQLGIPWTGWNPEIINPIEIFAYGLSNAFGAVVGNENEKLIRLFSMNENFTNNQEIQLSGEYDGSAITTSQSVNLQEYINKHQLPVQINIKYPDYITPIEKLFGKIFKMTGELTVRDDSGSITFNYNDMPILIKITSYNLVESMQQTGDNSDYTYQKTCQQTISRLVAGVLSETKANDSAVRFLSIGGNHLSFRMGLAPWCFITNNEGTLLKFDISTLLSSYPDLGNSYEGTLIITETTEEEWNIEYSKKGII